MQWTGDRNAGFSKADTAQLYLPAISDPVFGYQAINVESQVQPPHSLLNWMRRLISIRKQSTVLGRGSIEFLRNRNEKVLVHIREFQGEVMLLVHNLAGSAQAVELDLTRFLGAVPIEQFGLTRFPQIGKPPYQLSLAPYGYYWFRLRQPEDPRAQYGIENTAI